MRQIGTLQHERDAQLLVDYLLTQGIASQLDTEGDAWAVWVREEHQVDEARKLLEEFERDPTDARYQSARHKADQLRTQSRRQRTEAARRTMDMRQQWNLPLSRRAPLVIVMIGLSVFVSLATGSLGTGRAKEESNPLKNILMFGDTTRRVPGDLPGELGPGAPDPLAPLRQGQVWRMVTPIFLHADWLHLLFNMSMLYFLGTQIEARRGTVRMGGLVLALALISNWAQYLLGHSPKFLGMSGVVYGLFGYMWTLLRIDPRCGYMLGQGTVFLMLFFLVLGFTGTLDGVSTGVANWAHVGGLVAGMAIAAVTSGRRGTA
jgi:GlpG protein